MSKNICQNSVKQKIPYPKRDSKKENKKRKYYHYSHGSSISSTPFN